MSKRNVNITSVEDLQMEERRVRKRLKKQETELIGRVKQLPEEVVTVAAVKLISGVMQGGALKTIVSVAKKVGKNVFSALMKDSE